MRFFHIRANRISRNALLPLSVGAHFVSAFSPPLCPGFSRGLEIAQAGDMFILLSVPTRRRY
jgi:hypothetical protein